MKELLITLLVIGVVAWLFWENRRLTVELEHTTATLADVRDDLRSTQSELEQLKGIMSGHAPSAAQIRAAAVAGKSGGKAQNIPCKQCGGSGEYTKRLSGSVVACPFCAGTGSQY